MRLIFALGLASLACTLSAPAQQDLIPPSEATAAERPSLHLIRYEEDWSSLCNPKARSDLLDPLKCMSLRMLRESSYVSLGGEFRGVHEDVLDDNWSNTPYPTNSFWLERFQLHSDWHLNPRLRLFVQLESGLEQGRSGGARSIDEKRLDFLNAFADFGIGSVVHPVTLRVGRQELNFGSGRLVSVREGPNVRLGFYGLRLSQTLGSWSMDVFAVRPAIDNMGFFDNIPDHKTEFWGTYATRPWTKANKNTLDLYYFGIDRKSATFDIGTAHEIRETIGGRIATPDQELTAGRTAIPHFDIESAYQFGSFGSSHIHAWTIATEFGYLLPKLVLTPKIGMRSDISSGGGNPTSDALHTFNALYPIGNYFGVLADTGPGPVNFRDLHPKVRLSLPHSVSLDADWVIWWRQSLNDGVYGTPGNLLVHSGMSDARFVGHRPGLETRWQIDRHAYLQADYGVFFAGPFLRQSAHKKNLNYTSFWAGYEF